jgi:uncharacterized protein YwqG
MGIFDFFKGKKENTTQNTGKELLELVEMRPGIGIPRALEGCWPDINKSRMNCISITASPENDLSLEQSKFGHYPCMPAGFEYPKDAEGRYMFLLAQINFSEMPPLEGYPTSGYLQFYIAAFDDVYGLDFDNPFSQKNFRVLFFEESEVENYTADFSFLDETLKAEMLPLNKPHALQFSAKEEFVGLGDVRENIHVQFAAVYELHPELENDLENFVWENFMAVGHKIGGYAYFTQEDPRLYKKEIDDYLLLLQINSDDEIMWGDAGVANFFIHPDDLAKKDFSKVFYNWDCS